MGIELFIVCRGGHTVNSRSDRLRLAALAHKMHFPAAGIAATRYDSLRARTGARSRKQKHTVFSSGEPGGVGLAPLLRLALPGRGRRLPPLRQHRRKLATA